MYLRTRALFWGHHLSLERNEEAPQAWLLNQNQDHLMSLPWKHGFPTSLVFSWMSCSLDVQAKYTPFLWRSFTTERGAQLWCPASLPPQAPTTSRDCEQSSLESASASAAHPPYPTPVSALNSHVHLLLSPTWHFFLHSNNGTIIVQVIHYFVVF